MTSKTPEENILKCSSELVETKTFENISNPLDNNPPSLYNHPFNSEIDQETKLNQLSTDLTIKKNLVKQPMIKLYDLEKKENPISFLKIDLDIDLYQMEDY